MRRVAGALAAVLCALMGAGCGGGADSEAPAGATLVLDFQPNAVHAGIYTALHRGFFEQQGLELRVRQPSASTDSLKLLEAGRADFGVLDINDLGLARERGLDLVAFAAVVQRPLASVIAADRTRIRRPRDLEGKLVGVTGLPSDDAVLDGILMADGGDPDRVRRVTIGFDAVAALQSGRLDAATGFWNAEGVQLHRLGVPTREFRVDEFQGPRYPELVLATTREALREDRRPACRVLEALEHAYRSLGAYPDASLDALLTEVPGLDREAQRAQLEELLASHAFTRAGRDRGDPILPAVTTAQWVWWARGVGVLKDGPGEVRRVGKGFVPGGTLRCDSLDVLLFG